MISAIDAEASRKDPLGEKLRQLRLEELDRRKQSSS